MGSKVLVVDDEERILEICEYFLRADGYEVHATRDSTQALETAKGQHFDLVIADVVMPGMGGYQFAKELRLSMEGKDTPILFLSAKVQIPELFFEHFSGNGDFLIKPFKKQDLLGKVRGLVARPAAPGPLAGTPPTEGGKTP